jgi:hypothetical protein
VAASRWRSTIQPSDHRAASIVPASEVPRRRPAAPRQVEHRRIVGAITAKSDGSGSRRCALAAANLDIRMPVEVVGENSEHGDLPIERVDLLELKAARPDDVNVRRDWTPARPAASDVAADCHLETRRLEIRPVSAVVVDLPFVLGS